MALNLCWSRFQKPGENLIAFPGKQEIFFGYSSLIMSGEHQRHLVITNVNIRMMIHFQCLFGNPAHEIYAHRELLKLECATDGLHAFGPIRNRFQVKADLFCGQGWHDIKSILVSPGAAFFTTAGEFVDGGPSPRFRGFGADTFFLVAGLDVCRLTFLLVSVTGFIALGHDWSLDDFDRFAVHRPYRKGHIDVQRRAQINFMLLLLHDDRTQSLA